MQQPSLEGGADIFQERKIAHNEENVDVDFEKKSHSKYHA